MIDLSIIIPTYNRKDYLLEAVNSCLLIKNYNIEIIVVDDGSTDGTYDIEWKDERIKFIKQEHINGNRARNTGLKIAKGKYIKYLDDDDLLIASSVEKQISIMDKNGYNITYCAWLERIENLDNSISFKAVNKEQIVNPLESLLMHWSCTPFSYMLRKEIFNDIYWDEDLTGFQDTDYFIKIAEKCVNFYYLNEIIGFWRKHNSDSIMKANQQKRMKNIYRIYDNAIRRYEIKDIMTPELKNAIAEGLYYILRLTYVYDRDLFKIVANKIYYLNPKFKPKAHYIKSFDKLLVPILGIKNLEYLLGIRRNLLNYFGHK